MRQLSLRAATGLDACGAAPETQTNALEVWDLFCGAGGFSLGARLAGHRVVFACDASVDVLVSNNALSVDLF